MPHALEESMVWGMTETDESTFGKVPLAHRRPDYLEYQRGLNEWYENADIIDTPMDTGEPVGEESTLPWGVMLGAVAGAFIGAVLTRLFEHA